MYLTLKWSFLELTKDGVLNSLNPILALNLANFLFVCFMQRPEKISQQIKEIKANIKMSKENLFHMNFK